MIPGQRILVDRSLSATFVRQIDDERAIIRVGEDTRVVSLQIIGEVE